MQLRLFGQKYRTVEARREFFRQLVERLERQNGVIATSGVLFRPLEGTVGWDTNYAIDGQSLDEAQRKANRHTFTSDDYRRHFRLIETTVEWLLQHLELKRAAD